MDISLEIIMQEVKTVARKFKVLVQLPLVLILRHMALVTKYIMAATLSQKV